MSRDEIIMALEREGRMTWRQLQELCEATSADMNTLIHTGMVERYEDDRWQLSATARP